MMVKLFLCLVPVLVLANPSLRLQDSMPLVTEEMVRHINHQGGWTASIEYAKGMTIGDAKRRLGSTARQTELPPKKFELQEKYTQAPTGFNASEEWPSCIHPIRNQGSCGAGWAFGATGAFSDRICISTNGAVNVELAPQTLVSCSTVNFGCGGGFLDVAWVYMAKYGVPVEACDPYQSGDNDESGACQQSCNAVYKPVNLVSLTTKIAIQASIMAAGPVETTFLVYQDFYAYTGGVYRHTTGNFVGGHSVKITGWGNLNGTDYWLAANSWGTDWGLNGYFLIAFDECEFDKSAITGDYSAS